VKRGLEIADEPVKFIKTKRGVLLGQLRDPRLSQQDYFPYSIFMVKTT
jgi:hypothetical protein